LSAVRVNIGPALGHAVVAKLTSAEPDGFYARRAAPVRLREPPSEWHLAARTDHLTAPGPRRRTSAPCRCRRHWCATSRRWAGLIGGRPAAILECECGQVLGRRPRGAQEEEQRTMYITLRRRPHTAADLAGTDSAEPRSVGSSNIVALGLTSLFTDISSEMVAAILPLYLTFQLRLTTAQFGLVDGLGQAIATVTLLSGAVIADRSRRYKEVAAAGYAVSAGCKVGLWAAGGAWLPTTGVLFLDRTAKGLRTPPRDSLISLSAKPGRIATAFGVHRALDTTGAVLGPFVAFALLFAAPGAYESVFFVSFCIAMIGLGILVVFVDGISGHPSQRRIDGDGSSLRAVFRLAMAPGLRRILVAAVLLNVLTISDGFMYLILQHGSSFQTRFFPLLFVGTAVTYLLLAVPMGRLADRIGARATVGGGYVLLLSAYGLLLVGDPGPWVVLSTLGLIGAYYAATDGVVMALASAVVPAGTRATGLALVASVVAGARLVSSLGFGILWGQVGPRSTISIYLVALAVILPVAIRRLDPVALR